MSDARPVSGWRVPAFVGAVLLALAATLWIDAGKLPELQTAGVGPAAAPRVIAVLLVLLAIAHGIAAWRLRSPAAPSPGPEPSPVVNRSSIGWILGGLVGLIAVLEAGGGFILGSAWLFAATARAFGQPMRLKSPVVGLVLATLVYVFFTQVLTLSLPAGPLERLLG